MADFKETVVPAVTKPRVEPLQRIVPLAWLLVVIVVVAALKSAASVILPLVFALFLVAIFFPLHRRLQRHMRHNLATAITLLVFLTALGTIGVILWMSSLAVIERLPVYAEEFDHFARIVESYGIAMPGYGSDAETIDGSRAIDLDPAMLLEVVPPVLGTGGLIMLIFSYLVLSLLAFDDYALRVQKILPSSEGHRWLEIARQVSVDFQSYIVVRTIIGLISGGAVGVAAWLLGLDFAFFWGLLSFLLSYIPIFGSVIALVLPLLFALAQFDTWQKIMLAVVTLVMIRLILAIVVEPLLQGKFLKPTPLTVLLSVTFWGWLWGVTGAFIGVPLTILLVIICHQFQETRWISVLLADVEQDQEEIKGSGQSAIPSSSLGS